MGGVPFGGVPYGFQALSPNHRDVGRCSEILLSFFISPHTFFSFNFLHLPTRMNIGAVCVYNYMPLLHDKGEKEYPFF